MLITRANIYSVWGIRNIKTTGRWSVYEISSKNHPDWIIDINLLSITISSCHPRHLPETRLVGCFIIFNIPETGPSWLWRLNRSSHHSAWNSDGILNGRYQGRWASACRSQSTPLSCCCNKYDVAGTMGVFEDQRISKRPISNLSPTNSPQATKRTEYSTPSPDYWRKLFGTVKYILDVYVVPLRSDLHSSTTLRKRSIRRGDATESMLVSDVSCHFNSNFVLPHLRVIFQVSLL